MTVKFRYFLLYFLAGLSVFIILTLKFYSRFPFFIEHFYSKKLYQKLSASLRHLLGNSSFNVGDFIFISGFLLILYLIYKIYQVIWYRKYSKVFNKRIYLLVFIIFSYNYIIFNLIWGLNYQRIPLKEQLLLDAAPATPHISPVKLVAQRLTASLNELFKDTHNTTRLLNDNMDFKFCKTLVSQEINRSNTHPLKINGRDSVLIFDYRHPSIKKSVLGFIFNKMGISGYHHPFTAEAVINTSNIPAAFLPAVMTHEVMHQLGYPKEEEAALLCFILTQYLEDPRIIYSIYLDCFVSLLNKLKKEDPVYYDHLYYSLPLQAQNDIHSFYEYISAYKYSVSFLKTDLYALFFALNSETKGIENNAKTLQLIADYLQTQTPDIRPASHKKLKKIKYAGFNY